MTDQPLTIESLRNSVGTEVFDLACLQAWKSAPGTGASRQRERNDPDNAIEMIMDEITDRAHLFQSDDAEFDFYTTLYRQMPAYTIACELLLHLPYYDMTNAMKKRFCEAGPLSWRVFG